MAIKGINFDRSLVTPLDEARILSTIMQGRSAVLSGFSYDSGGSNATSLMLKTGLAVVQGFAVKATDTAVDTTGLANAMRYLCLTIDLNQANVSSGTVGTSSYNVVYKQCRFDFLDEQTMIKQLATEDANGLHLIKDAKSVVSLPLYKAVFSQSGSLPAMTRINSSFFDGANAGSPDIGIAARCEPFNHFLNKVAVQSIPLNGLANRPVSSTASQLTPYKLWQNERLVHTDPRALYAQNNIVVEKDGIYRIDIHGSINICDYTRPASGNSWRVGGRYFEFTCSRNNSADNLAEFGVPKHLPPEGTWNTRTLVGGYTYGVTEQAISATATVALFKGDNFFVQFKTAAPVADSSKNTSAITTTNTVGTSGTHLRNFSYTLERVGDLDGESFFGSGTF